MNLKIVVVLFKIFKNNWDKTKKKFNFSTEKYFDFWLFYTVQEQNLKNKNQLSYYAYYSYTDVGIEHLILPLHFVISQDSLYLNE